MQNDTKSTGSSSSSSNVDSSPQSTLSKAKDNVYRKFFKTSTGNKLLKQGQTSSTLPERRRAEDKENASKGNKASKNAASARSASETRKYASSSTSSTPSFPILSGRQIYPQTQKVEKAHLVKVIILIFLIVHLNELLIEAYEIF